MRKTPDQKEERKLSEIWESRMRELDEEYQALFELDSDTGGGRVTRGRYLELKERLPEVKALEAQAAASANALEEFVSELQSWNEACLAAASEGHGPPSEEKFGYLMAEYDHWRYDYNKKLIQKLMEVSASLYGLSRPPPSRPTLVSMTRPPREDA